MGIASILSEDMAKKIADLSSDDEDDRDNDKITMMNLMKEYLVPKEETYIVPHVTESKFETAVSKHITGKKLFESYKKIYPNLYIAFCYHTLLWLHDMSKIC